MLTGRQRAFADAWDGIGTGKAAAIAAGYTGTAGALEVTASRLLRHAGVRARIAERLGSGAVEPEPIEPNASTSPAPETSSGTPSERVAILMSIARDPAIAPKDRTAACVAAARISGEIGPGRYELPRAPKQKLPPASREPDPAPVGPATARLAPVLVFSDRDRRVG